ncbi:hypothetical protein SAMN02927921_02569 [Sinomicrobium oceani]|uniref:Uncharacterized protein n=1 Tax=Sinomicrobium oceani TaxID=1150368 RepID=A0A1K1QH95_9FLAO|nr:hypothetical protein [Sinomicrobium oceani]SFW59298.1 hypothetical protein SAMN02927921_02569 [Sinomicrobium oceani]
MIIFRGWGILALLIPVFSIIAGLLLFSNDGNASRKLLMGSIIFSGILTLISGILLKQKTNRKHDLYYIPLNIWGIIWLVLGVVGMIYTYMA